MKHKDCTVLIIISYLTSFSRFGELNNYELLLSLLSYPRPHSSNVSNLLVDLPLTLFLIPICTVATENFLDFFCLWEIDLISIFFCIDSMMFHESLFKVRCQEMCFLVSHLI